MTDKIIIKIIAILFLICSISSIHNKILDKKIIELCKELTDEQKQEIKRILE